VRAAPYHGKQREWTTTALTLALAMIGDQSHGQTLCCETRGDTRHWRAATGMAGRGVDDVGA
jgi:hypothetical protein